MTVTELDGIKTVSAEDLTTEQADEILAYMLSHGMWNGVVQTASKQGDAANHVNNCIRYVRNTSAASNPIALRVLELAGLDLAALGVTLPEPPVQEPEVDPEPPADPEPEPEKHNEPPPEDAPLPAMPGAERDSGLNDDHFVELAEIAERAEVTPEEVSGWVRDNFGRDVEDMSVSQYEIVYGMLKDAADGAPDEPEQEPEQPPFEPDPTTPKLNVSGGTGQNRRRVRASDGKLVYREELELYEEALRASLPTVELSQQDQDLNKHEPPESVTEPSTGTSAAAFIPAHGLIAKQTIERERASALAAKERLPIPPEIEGTPELLPADFTVLPDVEVRRLHSVFHSYLSRASYLLACEESDVAATTAIHQDAFNRAMRAEAGASEKEAKVTLAKASATLDPDVIKWRQALHEHVANVRQLKMLRDYYDSTCARLSREASMRHAERESFPNG